MNPKGNILPKTNTENHEIAFNIEIQNSKMFRYKLKNVKAQSQKLGPNISKIKYFRIFELKTNS